MILLAVKKGYKGEEVSVFIEQSFDYSHFLPESDKCFPLHGHTSLVNLEIRGELPPSGMLIDFGEARRLLGKILSLLDHKLVTNRRYATERGNGSIEVKYDNFDFYLPRDQTFLLDGEGTSENIALAISGMLIDEMPSNVSYIKLMITEGLRKGTIVEKFRKK
jgi:6-pyruvoyl-tetrahydropterin synthase